MKKIPTLLAVVISLLTPQLFANDTAGPGYVPGFGDPQAAAGQMNWMGVSLAPVPAALRDQLSQLIPAGQGVLVSSISPSSPASRAGIRQHDVLLSYDDQKLYSAGQLSGLVRSDRSGREVSMRLVQNGQLKNLKVKLASQQGALHQPQSPQWQYPPRGYSPFGRQPPQVLNSPGKQALAWDSFESVQVNTLPDGRYHAQISFKNSSNETKKFSFEGRREEIIAQINSQQALPADKKQALLNALNMRSDGFMNQPFFRGNPFDTPSFDRNPFNDPFFQHNPFDDPFFKRFFQFRTPSPLLPEQINGRRGEIF